MIRRAIMAVPLGLALTAAAYAATPAAAPHPAATANPAIVKAATATREQDLHQAQRMLKKDGDYRGPIDGKSGPKTIRAIQKFQRKNGLKQTGWLDEATWNGLRREYGSATSASAHGTAHRAM